MTFKSKISTKKTNLKFPVYNKSKIIRNGIGVYDAKKINSNLFIKFKNVENIINKPKRHFSKYKYGLILNFKIKFKEKNNLIHLDANNFSLKKYIKGQFYDLSTDKKLHSKFLKIQISLKFKIIKILIS